MQKKQQWVRVLVFLAFAGAVALVGMYVTSSPGVSVPAATAEAEDSPTVKNLKRHVMELADIGERRATSKNALDKAEEYIRLQLRRMGYSIEEQEYDFKGWKYRNLEVEIPGSSMKNEVVVLGAHYDTHRRTPGADDNASGCAVLLELARELKNDPGPRTLKMVFFTLGEWPQQGTDDMGSWRWVDAARKRPGEIVAMLSLDSVGVYNDQPGRQSYPPLLSFYYPQRGDFVGFFGNFSSRDLLHRCVQTFRGARRMPAEGLLVPGWSPGTKMSDHASFWRAGIPAVLVTDTMGWRYEDHHGPLDMPDALDYERMALLCEGLVEVTRALRMAPSL